MLFACRAAAGFEHVAEDFADAAIAARLGAAAALSRRCLPAAKHLTQQITKPAHGVLTPLRAL